MKVSFFLKKSYKTTEGKHPFVCRISNKGARFEFRTGLFLSPKAFNEKTKKAKDKTILMYQNKLEKDLFDISCTNNVHEPKNIYLAYKQSGTPEKTFMDNYDQKIIHDAHVKNLSSSYQNKLQNIKKILKSYFLAEFNSKDVTTQNIHSDTFVNFQNFLLLQGYNENYILSILSITRPVFKKYISDENLKTTIKRKKSEIKYLDFEVLQEIEGLSFQGYMDFIRNMFLFMCYTGMHYNDLKNLRHENIKKTLHGGNIIKYTRTKTNNVAVLPLFEKARVIIEKNKSVNCEALFDLPSNFYFNKKLKEIKTDLTTKIARKTFATMLQEEGWTMEEIGFFLGHSPKSITGRYYSDITLKQITDKRERINSYFDKSTNKEAKEIPTPARNDGFR